MARDLKIENLYCLPASEAHGYERLYQQLFSRKMVELWGPSGSTFLVDGFSLHRGTPPISNNRLL